MLDFEVLLQSKRLIMIYLISNDEKEWNTTPSSSLSTPSLSLDELKEHIDVFTSQSSVSCNILIDDLDIFEMVSSPQSARLFIRDITEQILSETNTLNSFVSFGRLTAAFNHDSELNDSTTLHCNNGQPRLSEFLKYR